MNRQSAFTLIELMIVVAIIGILAAIAFPAYQDYVTRAKVSELVVAADSCKVSIIEYYQSQAKFPADMNAAGCSDQKTKYVASMVVQPDTGVIEVTALVGADAIDAKAAGMYILKPTVTPTGNLDWDCKDSTIPAKYLPPICRA